MTLYMPCEPHRHIRESQESQVTIDRAAQVRGEFGGVHGVQACKSSGVSKRVSASCLL